MDKQLTKVINDRFDDFGDVMIMCLRYGLGRRTYVTSEIPGFIAQNPEHINERVCTVMIRDLNQYQKDRDREYIKDDDCDYNSWIGLLTWLIQLASEKQYKIYE